LAPTSAYPLISTSARSLPSSCPGAITPSVVAPHIIRDARLLAELVGCSLIPIGDASTRLRVMLPLTLSPFTARHFVLVFTSVDVVIDVCVLVNIHIDIPVTPVTATPGVTPRRTHSNTSGKRECHCSVRIRVDRWRRICRIGPHTIDYRRVVRRHVDDLRVCGLYHDVLGLLFHNDLLLLGGLEVPRSLRLLPQPLHRSHHIFLLRKDSVSQLLCPVQLIVHHGQHIGEIDERFDARVPGLLLKGFGQLVSLETRICLYPARRLNYFERIRRGHKYLRQEIVRVERNRRNDLLQLFRFK